MSTSRPGNDFWLTFILFFHCTSYDDRDTFEKPVRLMQQKIPLPLETTWYVSHGVMNADIIEDKRQRSRFSGLHLPTGYIYVLCKSLTFSGKHV